MKKTTIKISTILFLIVLILLSLSCGNGKKENAGNAQTQISSSSPKEDSTEEAETRKTPDFVDVPTLANKSAAEFDAVFGKPVQVTEITDNPAMMPGEYRLYSVSGHPKGLSVRFFRDRAKRFNLLLGAPRKSSKAALSEIFKINVGEISPDKTSEPLSEKWKGRFDGINFVTVYAKREKVTGDFTMVHAEVGK